MIGVFILIFSCFILFYISYKAAKTALLRSVALQIEKNLKYIKTGSIRKGEKIKVYTGKYGVYYVIVIGIASGLFGIRTKRIMKVDYRKRDPQVIYLNFLTDKNFIEYE